MIFLLDACALIAYLSEERGQGYEAVSDLFYRAEKGEVTLCISILNLAEVRYNYIREVGIGAVDGIMWIVHFFPISIIETITDEVYREASRFKVQYAMSFADTFLCATAKSLGATIVTKDSELRKPEQAENLPVLWINQ